MNRIQTKLAGVLCIVFPIISFFLNGNKFYLWPIVIGVALLYRQVWAWHIAVWLSGLMLIIMGLLIFIPSDFGAPGAGTLIIIALFYAAVLAMLLTDRPIGAEDNVEDEIAEVDSILNSQASNHPGTETRFFQAEKFDDSANASKVDEYNQPVVK